MPVAAQIRDQVEAVLANRIPYALRMVPREIRPLVSTGIVAVDAILDGGLPAGAITEIVGAECSGRTSLALSFVARQTQAGKVCAWIDVSNVLQPESAAAAGVELSRLLWVRCGNGGRVHVENTRQQTFVLPERYLVPPQIKKGLHGGGCGGHPRGEVKGLSEAVRGLLQPEQVASGFENGRDAGGEERLNRVSGVGQLPVLSALKGQYGSAKSSFAPGFKIDQALRVTDLLLQGGGFSAIVLDMGGIAPEFSRRIPLATWFRYRAAAEKGQTSVLLLTQHACANSSAGLVLQLRSGAVNQKQTVFTGIEHCLEIARQRFAGQEPGNVIPLRKPPQRVTSAAWQARTTWAGRQ